MSSTPITDVAATELSGLVALGFTENQAMTLIVAATIRESNASKKPAATAINSSNTFVTPPAPRKLVALIDTDGDRWTPDPARAGNWVCHAARYMGSESRQGIEEATAGPVTEVWE